MDLGGITSRIRDAAAASSRPVASPSTHSTPDQPQSTAAASMAAALARKAERSQRFTRMGVSGVRSSIIPRSGEKGSCAPLPSSPALPISHSS